ncbi:rhomboid family intramembrane serine protease [Chitiniphilus purpureus]|uniref:Rhomboid family intramembrane serine protease n=1 Tax=Chitiniphilus purpureus TaxID=2981137 RepID=A0ABY6DPG8_9NEIS|nr:rhomboid family intramembrane serine protease [Chitiniphilus sp. CD1]UXY16260.1 rhomboid family intramembrane serine protease [Chitiniphilus sp. CD1]
MSILPPPSWFRRSPVTLLLLGANVLVMLLQLLQGVSLWGAAGGELVRWGANQHGLTLGGEPWRLLSSMFLHIGVVHLLVNMYSLAILGPLLERQLGPVRFSLLYLVAGLAGGLASTLWNAATISAGASGAIMGLAGACFALLLAERHRAGPGGRQALRQIGQVIVLNLALGLIIDGIDNANHIGGLLGGGVLAWGYAWAARRPHAGRDAFAIALGALALLGGLLYSQRTDTLRFDAALIRFVDTMTRYDQFGAFWLRTDPATRTAAFARAQTALSACAKEAQVAAGWRLPAADARLARQLGDYCNLRLAQYRVNEAQWRSQGDYGMPDLRYRGQADQLGLTLRPALTVRLKAAYHRNALRGERPARRG